METILKLENLHKSYGSKEVLKGINLEVKKGEIISVLGPSGCGKSTLLNVIAGILPIEEGLVYINGQIVSDKKHVTPIEKRSLNMVFQDYALWPHMTAEENILYGLKLKHTDKEECAKKLKEMEELLHLNGLMKQYPSELSGGQQQRVAIARALIMNPAMVLLDEPLCNLDVQLRIEMRTEMAEIFHTLHTTVFHVTHDPSEAFAMADRIIIMNDGIIDQDDVPERCYENPASSVVAGLLGAGNKLDGVLRDNQVFVGNQSLNVVMHEGCANGVELRFRAEEVEFTKEETDNSLSCKVILPTFEGGTWRVIGQIQDTEVTFLSKEKLEKGLMGYLKFNPKKVYAYAKNHH